MSEAKKGPTQFGFDVDSAGNIHHVKKENPSRLPTPDEFACDLWPALAGRQIFNHLGSNPLLICQLLQKQPAVTLNPADDKLNFVDAHKLSASNLFSGIIVLCGPQRIEQISTTRNRILPLTRHLDSQQSVIAIVEQLVGKRPPANEIRQRIRLLSFRDLDLVETTTVEPKEMPGYLFTSGRTRKEGPPTNVFITDKNSANQAFNTLHTELARLGLFLINEKELIGRLMHTRNPGWILNQTRRGIGAIVSDGTKIYTITRAGDYRLVELLDPDSPPPTPPTTVEFEQLTGDYDFTRPQLPLGENWHNRCGCHYRMCLVKKPNGNIFKAGVNIYRCANHQYRG